jgi:hypothetical protein
MVDLAALVTALLALVVALGFYVSWRATRLDRLHARIDTALAALDAALVRRCASVLEVATSGLLDPAASLLLIEAEQEARLATDHEQRELAESRLSQALRAVWAVRDTASASSRPRPDGGIEPEARNELLAELEAAQQKIPIARLFYNDSVNATINARKRLLPASCGWRAAHRCRRSSRWTTPSPNGRCHVSVLKGARR